MSEKSVTKSVRLSPAESEELAQLSAQTTLPESILMKKWIQEGIQAQKIEMAVQAYMQRKTDLRGGAAMAGVSYNRFLHEVQSRNIVILDDERMMERLSFLADAFDDDILRKAIGRVLKETADVSPSTGHSRQ